MTQVAAMPAMSKYKDPTQRLSRFIPRRLVWGLGFVVIRRIHFVAGGGDQFGNDGPGYVRICCWSRSAWLAATRLHFSFSSTDDDDDDDVIVGWGGG